MQRGRMKTAPSDSSVQRMLALTRAALHGTAPDANLFVDAGGAEWTEIFELSVTQGVMVLSLNGAILLPKELHPPVELKLRWIAGADAVAKGYLHRLETAKDLTARFRENNLRMMVFKGIALSQLYPEPESREFGDIDIFLCGKAEEGDALLEYICDKKYGGSKKNINYSYRGVLIENHHTFIYHAYHKCFYRSRDLENTLLTTLKEAGITGNENIVAPTPANETVLFPPPEFNALHVILHALSHLPSGIVLRHLCDLVVIFKDSKGKIDFSLHRNLLTDAKLIKVIDALISLSVRHLGLNRDDAPFYESDTSLEDRLWNDILNPKVTVLPVEKRTFFNVLINNIQSIKFNYWKYLLLFQGKFLKMVIHYTIFRLLTLKTTVKK